MITGILPMQLYRALVKTSCPTLLMKATLVMYNIT